jgi:hypothetical protein
MGQEVPAVVVLAPRRRQKALAHVEANGLNEDPVTPAEAPILMDGTPALLWCSTGLTLHYLQGLVGCTLPALPPRGSYEQVLATTCPRARIRVIRRLSWRASPRAPVAPEAPSRVAA